ncbi:MAG: methionine gamma-lyase family protein, partial [Clostridia bacterium]|nr:methionine gamma-lyase family protein [Clostridia bacterium]
SLRDWGVLYDSVDLLPDGSIDIAGLREKMESYGNRLKMVYVQRSRGYSSRPALSVKQITEAAYHTKVFAGENGLEKPIFTVDNCYGEFVEEYEPCCTVPNEDKSLGADIAIGSLIKNPGGGMADVGGYIVGREEYVKLCGNRLTCPGVGLDVGASLGQTRNILKGLFYAPHTVAQALKTAHLAAYIFESLGLGVSPGWREKRHDIVQTVCCGSAAALEAFCAGIQSGSPIDAHVTPVPWAMPGYPDEVIMAAGAFTGGSSIELSADGPMRAPYNAYMQGGLTYESARLAIMAAAEKVSNTI